MKLHESITLPDGRRLAYSEIGETTHFPILYFHGFPGSRLEAGFSEEAVRQCGVRVISIERPGYGQSCIQETRSILDWADDITCFADTLGLDEFSTLGVSTGGLYALACAYALPDRVISTGLGGSLAPLSETSLIKEMSFVNRQAFIGLSNNSAFANFMVKNILGGLIKTYPKLFLKLLKLSLCRKDHEALKDENFHHYFFQSIQEAYAQGLYGPYYDLYLTTQDWGFQPEEVTVPVYLWHGLDDTISPPAMGRYLNEHLVDCEAFFLEGEGHFSIVGNYMANALMTLRFSRNLRQTTASQNTNRDMKFDELKRA